MKCIFYASRKVIKKFYSKIKGTFCVSGVKVAMVIIACINVIIKVS